jgi:hypothetical protein
MVQLAETIWRDFVTDGVPSTGANEPRKRDIREWGTWIEGVAAGAFAGAVVFPSKETADINLDHAANTMAWVVLDSTPGDNGVYRKIGASGTGSWARIADLPYSYIKASDNGAGTPNAIQATTSIPVPAADGYALIALNIFEANTGSPVTVSFNGDTALAIKTTTGQDIAAGGLSAGMIVAGYKSGATFRLLTHLHGWSPVEAVEIDSSVSPSRRVRRLVDWAGGEGAKPGNIGKYIGPGGYVDTIAEATDVRGPAGPSGPGTGDMLTSVYDPEDIAEPIFDAINRAALVSRVSGGFVPTHGRVYRAGDLSYIGSAGATAIPDLPGLLPLGNIFVQHFGVIADMTYEEQQIRDATGTLISEYGWVRTGGTDWRSLIVLADAYAASVDRPLWFKDGGYYWFTELAQTARWLAETDFGVTLWANFAKVSVAGLDVAQSGLSCKTASAGLGVPGDHGFLIVGQFSSTTLKETGQGDLGSAYRINNFYTPEQQQVVSGLHVRAKFNRAALQRNASGVITQRSIGSILVTAMGGIEYSHFEIGVFGRTNVSSSHLILCHWQAYYDATSIKFAGATVATGGTGYASDFYVTVTGGGGGVTVTPVVKAIVSGGAVVSYDVEDWGEGLTEAPVFDHTPGGGTGATANVRFGDASTGDKTMATIVESYHFIKNQIDFITPIDNADGHKMDIPFDIASGGHVQVRGVKTFGLNGTTFGGALGSVSCGDVINQYTVASQKEYVGKAIHIIGPVARDVLAVTSGEEMFYVKGMGTSKANGDFEPGTRKFRQRQLPMDVTIENAQCYYHASQDPTLPQTVFLDRVFGQVRFPGLISVGAHKALEIEYCRGKFTGTVGGDGAVVNNFSSDVEWDLISSDRRNEQNSGNASAYAYGWGSTNSRAVEVTGGTVSLGNSSADFTLGSGTISLATPLATNVHRGDPVLIGTERVIAADMHCLGATQLRVSPAMSTVASGAAITLDRRARVSKLRAAFASSFNGIRVLNADVYGIDLSGIRYTGRFAILASGDSIVEVVGGELPFVGRAGGTLSNIRTIRMEDTSHLILKGVRARDNASVASHVQLANSSTALIEACLIEDVANFIVSALDSAGQVEWVGNFDFSRVPLSHPGRRGSNANGEWVKHPDGTLQCWLRGAALLSGGTTWTFPATFHAASTTFVTGQPTSTSAARAIGATNGSAASATIQMWDLTVAPPVAVGGGASLMAIGRWRA